MKILRTLIIALSAIIIPTLCEGSTLYYFITGQANVNTTIDAGHEMEWVAPSLTPSCLVTTCATSPITQFDATFDWSLGGGSFTMKVGNNPTDGITLTLWDGTVGGTLASPMGSVVESKKLPAPSVPGSYTAVDIVFDTPAQIQAGHSYVLTLTSDTGQHGDQQYFIKGMDVLGIQDSLSGTGNPLPDSAGGTAGDQAPEPSTWVMMAGGGALVLLSRVKRARRLA
jgi:hypothetical protein